ncbi:hypothetical protein LIER_31446 [Lithospermum erythrorhizon]|uniref:Uncharacterized protein n=1 Tax=Lithospermum erythrorhizon TaxID=34254 RepID=A0AAV3RV04_LITER
MLVDTGSSTDILYLSTYDKLGLPRNMLQPMHTPLTGFIRHSVYPKGMAILDFTVGSGNKKVYNQSPVYNRRYPGFSIK